MIQLAASGSNGEVFLDLYEQDPIKLNFNIEDILDVAIKSEYSRQFRVPATDKNTDFFVSAFEINGVDYNPTTKKDARILIDGAEFRTGEIRLQKIYKNEPNNIIDYEVIFLGSTKNLGSKLGNKTINDLDLSTYVHELSYENVTGSWEAFPEGSSLTDGIFNGDIVYPLVDFGNNYADDGTGFYTVVEPRIAIGPSSTTRHFTNAGWPIKPNRFRPIMRVRKILELIFQEAGFSYDSNFFDTNEAHQMYLTAWGDDAIVRVNGKNANLAKAGLAGEITFGLNNPGPQSWQGLTGLNFDYGNNLSPTNGPFTTYTAPLGGDYSYNYDVNIGFKWASPTNTGTDWQNTVASGPFGWDWRTTLTWVNGIPKVEIEVDQGSGFFLYAESEGTWNLIGNSYVAVVIINIYEEFTQTLTAGNTIDCVPNFTDVGITFGTPEFLQWTYVPGSNFEVSEAPGEFTIQQGFNSDYKQLDFLKDVFKMFRLVLIPDPFNPTNFKIEPWQQYIGSGNVKDWTAKLDLSKDIVIQPLVNEQADKLVLTMAEDKDWLNQVNQDRFKETFGTAIINSGYEVLDGEKEIKVGIAPTPTTQIHGYFVDSASWGETFIPQICTIGSENDIIVVKPIQPKPRIVYYTGQHPSGTWYFQSGSTTNPYTEVPTVSYYSQWLPYPNAKLLTFQKENGYDELDVINSNYGQDLYTRYWSDYVNLIYNKESRRLTAYFILDNYDLVNFEYSDVIFVKDTYFYVEKIYDAPLGQREKVKVDLIKLPNYRPNVANFVPIGEYWEDIAQNWENITEVWEQL